MRIIVDSMSVELFRKLKEIDEINFGTKINLFSGHNGVGKSNLLSIISSCSGTNAKRLNDGRFQPEFSDYFKIEGEEAYQDYKLYLKYRDDENYLTKRVSFKDDSDANRGIRIIPRTHVWPGTEKTVKEAEIEGKEQLGVGPAARINVPTLYVSLSRIFPIGETEIETKELRNNTKIIQQKLNLQFKKWYNQVLPRSIVEETDEMGVIKKSSANRADFYMEIDNASASTQSIGQDNLRNIITALVDFYALSLETEYEGGILCIDEVDSSLHPSAQVRLITLLNSIADELKLQIFISSHSLTLIKEIIRLNNKKPEDYKLIYLKGTRVPFVAKINDYETLKADLFQDMNPIIPKLKVYCEDEQAKKLLDLLVKTSQSFDIHVDLPEYEVIPVYLGEDHLKKLPDKDGYFKSVQILLDGDAKSKRKIDIKEYLENPNVVKGFNEIKISDNIAYLPSYLAPESYLYSIIHEYIENDDKYLNFWRSLESNPDTTNITSDKIVESIKIDKENLSTKEVKKKGKKIFEFVKKSQILKHYYSNEDKLDELKDFMKELEISMKKSVDTMKTRRY